MNLNMNLSGSGMANGGKSIDAASASPSTFKTIGRLLGYMKKSSLLIGLTFIIAIAGALMQVISPKILGNATTIIFNGFVSGTVINLTALNSVLLTVALLYLGVFVTSFLQERIMTVVSLKTTETLRNCMKDKLNRVPVSYFDKHSTGDLMSTAVNDIENIATNLQQSLTQLISSVILAVGILIIMLTISPLLTLVACLIIPLSFVITKIFTPIAQKYNKTFVKSMGSLNSTIEETYQNFTEVKAFRGEANALRAFSKSNETLWKSGWLAKFFGGSMMHFMMLVQNGIYILIAAIGAVQVTGGAILIGNLQAFLQYSQQFTSPFSKLSMIWGNLLSAVASAERIFALLDEKEMIDTESEKAKYPKYKSTDKVAFRSVAFGYDDTPLMHDFSLSVKQGEMVAIVGHTGAGKTTLINLMERFYDIQGGEITIDGVDIKDQPRGKIRSQMAIVLQDTWLFSGTIYENIKFGNPNASDEQIYAAAEAAYAHDFIEKLPQGYSTLITEDGGNLSQGQKQLITIARAFVANPDILILDEATSNVDSRTEFVIQKAMKKLLKGRTSFVIAHRLSTIYEADNIIVMDHGSIVETGRHEALLSQGGVYADIYNSQFAQSAA